jgi:rhodanese-related sulfurtransferase
VPVSRSVDELLADAREGLERIDAARAFVEHGEGAMLVDTRPLEQRQAHGTIPGARVIGLHVLEWRLDPQSPWREHDLADHDRRVFVLCREGYSSSLAAARLQQLGLHRATDVIDGFDGWRAAGLPIDPWSEDGAGG